MARDYRPKGVQVFFIYKSLAHPELVDGYIQPFTLEERLVHARRAEKRLGASIPWVVDAMDNRLKHALGDRPNSEFLVDPEGVIVRKRAWSNPEALRRDLEELVGSVDRVTRAEDIRLNLQPAPPLPAPRGVTSRIDREDLRPIICEPQVPDDGLPFFAKLRAEAEGDLLNSGTGRLYLGFHLDPLHNAHWNNLNQPLTFEIEAADDVRLSARTGVAESVAAATDTDPREFLLDVKAWPEQQTLRLTVRYFACVGDESCHIVRQQYVLHRRRDGDAGGARGDGAGFRDRKELARRLLADDRNEDGRLDRAEVSGIALPHFDLIDVNQDGLLDAEELAVVADWVNRQHTPGGLSREPQADPPLR